MTAKNVPGRITRQRLDYIKKTWRRQTPSKQAVALGISRKYTCQLRSWLIRNGECDPALSAGRKPWSAAHIRRVIADIRAGKDLAEIARAYGTRKDSVSLLLRKHGHCVADLRRSRVWTRNQLPALFSVDRATIRVWCRYGWLAPVAERSGHRSRLFYSRASIEAMLANRHTWMHWQPGQITDPDLQAFARFERRKRPGRWAKAVELVRELGYSSHNTSWFFDRGLITGETAQVARVWYVWVPA